MEQTIINGSDITVEGSRAGMPRIRITQPKDDVVVLNNHDMEEFFAAVRKHAGVVEEPDPTPEKNVVNGVDLRMSLVFAKATLRKRELDVAYERGRISYLNSIIEE